jgi:hypothetical protein
MHWDGNVWSFAGCTNKKTVEVGRMKSEEEGEWTVVTSSSAAAGAKNRSCKQRRAGNGNAINISNNTTGRRNHDSKPKKALYSTNACLLTDGPSSAKFVDVNAVITRIRALLVLMPRVAIFNHAIAQIQQQQRSQDEKEDSVTCIVSLGLGDICVSVTAMIQLAFVIAIRDHLQQSHTGSLIGMKIFEPLFTEFHVAVCEAFDIDVLSDNCYGRYSRNVLSTKPHPHADVSSGIGVDDGLIVYFMPHCPHSLYCNVLWTNWEQLDRIMIIGNRYVN